MYGEGEEMVRCPLSTLAWLARTRSVTAERPGSSNGSNVNLASRVEELTREHEEDILITEAVKDDLDASIRVVEQAPAHVNGVQEPIVTYAVRRSDAVSPSN